MPDFWFCTAFQVLGLQCVSDCWVAIVYQALPQLLVNNTFAAVLGASDNQLCILTQLNACVSVHMLQIVRDKIMADTVILGRGTLAPLPDHIKHLHRSYTWFVSWALPCLLACHLVHPLPCVLFVVPDICTAPQRHSNALLVNRHSQSKSLTAHPSN